MRVTHLLTAALLCGAALFGTASAAAADDPSTSPATQEGDAGPTEAGTTFRTATPVEQGRRASARASLGDYLYWAVPVDAGQRATVTAEVTLPASATRRGASTWQLDVYDGLRRRQPCTYGRQTKAVASDAGSVRLSCTLRAVRAWAEPWANDPLPGSYYLRLTVVDLAEQDLGLPVRAEVEARTVDTGGSQAVDGSLSVPLVPGAATAQDPEDDETESSSRTEAAEGPEERWSSGWWSDRWLWTAAGGVLAALAGTAGYCLTRGRDRP